MIRRDLETQLTAALADAFSEVGKKRDLFIPSQVESFLTDVVRESLILRVDDWQKRANLDVAVVENYPKVVGTVRQIVSKCIDGAANLPQYDKQSLSLISVVEWIKNNWCGIYPLCR